MSRWFRHYAGMARDDKLVRVSIKSKQSIERVVWVWTAILESASEIDDDGRYEIDHAEMARFLRCSEGKLAAIEDALRDLGRVHESIVAKWSGRQFQSDRSAARTKRYRDGLKSENRREGKTSRDDDVTSQKRHGDAPETETETYTSVSNETAVVEDFDKQLWDTAKAYLGSSKSSLIGKWCKVHGKAAVAAAITQAQVERPADRVEFITGILRKRAKAMEWTSPC